MPPSFRTLRSRCISVLAVALAVWLGGVATGCTSLRGMSAAACRDADWYGLGLEDGAAGADEVALAARVRDCSAHGVVPDRAAYDGGYAAGLEEYCEPTNGYTQGEARAPYLGVCPKRLASEFVRAYRAGERVREALDAVSEARREIRNNERELARVRSKLASLQAASATPRRDIQDAILARDEVRELLLDERELLAKLLDLEVELGRRNANVDKVREAVIR